MHFTYLIINLLTLAGPLAWSFESRISLYRKWGAMFPAMLITAVVFIVWDTIFTRMGVWGFNPAYTSSLNIMGLPLEEWLFFLTVPYASIFIYEIVKEFWGEGLPANLTLFARVPLLVLLAFLFSQNPTGWYTLVCLSFALFWLLVFPFFFKPKWLNSFFLAWLIHLIPFLVVNGILTSWPVVWYNDLENSGIRLFSIPMEDLFYSLSLFMMNVALYEFFKQRKRRKKG